MPRSISRRQAVGQVAAMTGLAVVPRWGLDAGAQGRAPDLLIRGGRVVNADGVRTADVRITGELITEVGPDLRASADTRVLDARGKLVMPGGIDIHTHLQPAFVDDLTSGSRAALAGGITTIGTFVGPRRDETPIAAFERMSGLVRSEAIADFIFHTFANLQAPEFATVLPELVQRGQPSIKVFMVGAGFGSQLAAFIELLEAARDAGVVTLVHCEDGALLAAAVRRLERAGRTSLAHYAESRPVVAEVAATQQLMSLGEATGAPVHVVHLSSGRALDACRAGRRAGVRLSVETRPLYLHLTEAAMQGPDAPLFVGQPPLRSAEDVEALWRGLLDGSIDMLATDHAPWRREQKLDPALTITRLRPGVSNLQHMLPMYWSEGVGQRGMTPERFVATTSTNAARRFGLFPRKGVIRVGSDADVLIWDPARTAPVRGSEDLSNADYSVYEGRMVTGWPALTIRRGEVVCEGGNVIGKAGTGKLIARAPWRA